MKRVLVCIFLVFSFVSIVPTLAQSDTVEWSVTLHVDGTDTLTVVTKDGIKEEIPLPANPEGYGNSLSLSSDERYLASQVNQDFDGELMLGRTISIADLQAQTCCTVLTAETPVWTDAFPVTSIGLIDFNPQDSRLLVYLLCDPMLPQELNCTNDQRGLALYDVETGTIEILPTSDFIKSAQMERLNWQPEGIRTISGVDCPPGTGCPSPLIRTYSRLYDPITGEELLSNPAIATYWVRGLDMGDYLSLTGEYVAPYFRPYTPDDVMSQLEPIIYYDSPNFTGDLAIKENDIFTTDEHLDAYEPNADYFKYVKWVADGQGVIVHRTSLDVSLLIRRSGKQEIIDMPPYYDFIAGTPDGWLMGEGRQGGIVYHYQVTDDGVTTTELATLPAGRVHILAVPQLGASVTEDFSLEPKSVSMG